MLNGRRSPTLSLAMWKAGLAAWTAGLAASLAALLWLDRGSLAGPPLLHPAQFDAWISSHTVTTAAFAAIRLLATVVACYLLAATLAGALARLLGRARAASILDRITLPGVRGLVAAVGALSIGAGSLAPPASARPRQPPAPAAASPAPAAPAPAAEQSRLPRPQVVVRAPAPRGSSGEPRQDTTAPSAVIRSIAPGPAPHLRLHPRPHPHENPGGGATARRRYARPPASAADSHAAPPASPPPPPTTAEGATTPQTWVTKPGDNLWSIAAYTVAEHLGRPPSDQEVAAYWSELLALNRSRLADPSNPDLIFSGQTFLLPSFSAAQDGQASRLRSQAVGSRRRGRLRPPRGRPRVLTGRPALCAPPPRWREDARSR